MPQLLRRIGRNACAVIGIGRLTRAVRQCLNRFGNRITVGGRFAGIVRRAAISGFLRRAGFIVAQKSPDRRHKGCFCGFGASRHPSIGDMRNDLVAGSRKHGGHFVGRRLRLGIKHIRKPSRRMTRRNRGAKKGDGFVARFARSFGHRFKITGNVSQPLNRVFARDFVRKPENADAYGFCQVQNEHAEIGRNARSVRSFARTAARAEAAPHPVFIAGFVHMRREFSDQRRKNGKTGNRPDICDALRLMRGGITARAAPAARSVCIAIQLIVAI